MAPSQRSTLAIPIPPIRCSSNDWRCLLLAVWAATPQQKAAGEEGCNLFPVFALFFFFYLQLYSCLYKIQTILTQKDGMPTESEPTLHKCILLLDSGSLRGRGAADGLWDWVCTRLHSAGLLWYTPVLHLYQT